MTQGLGMFFLCEKNKSIKSRDTVFLNRKHMYIIPYGGCVAANAVLLQKENSEKSECGNRAGNVFVNQPPSCPHSDIFAIRPPDILYHFLAGKLFTV
jgi:hypothetical protein